MIKNSKTILILFLILFVSQKMFADTHYVSKTGTHISPFDSWTKAATNIQVAVDEATVGDTVLVNDGTYYPTDQISVKKNIIVKSENGPEKTIVVGSLSFRCFFLNYENPTIDGFTITNGYEVTGGGIYLFKGGVIQNSIVVGNSSQKDGGGISVFEKGVVSNCYIFGNYCGWDGGAVRCVFGGSVKNSTLIGNTANWYGGGIRCRKGSAIENCVVKNNSAYWGGGVSCKEGGTVQNCLITKNSAELTGGGAQCETNSLIQNCTIVGNSAKINGGGVYCQVKETVRNSILWNNINGNYFSADSTNIYNCIENWTVLINGVITNDPKFISETDFRLDVSSPCIDAGTNFPYVYTTTDLDGYPRKNYSRVDMGAYEYIPEPILFINCYLLFIICYLKKRK